MYPMIATTAEAMINGVILDFSESQTVSQIDRAASVWCAGTLSFYPNVRENNEYEKQAEGRHTAGFSKLQNQALI